MATGSNRVPSRWYYEASPQEAGYVEFRRTNSASIFTAVANAGWNFSHWTFSNSGSGDFPAEVWDALEDTTSNPHESPRLRCDPDDEYYLGCQLKAVAHFVRDPDYEGDSDPEEDFEWYTVTAKSDPDTDQVALVWGSGMYTAGSIVTIECITRNPAQWKFLGWFGSDGSYQAERTFIHTVTGDITFIAMHVRIDKPYLVADETSRKLVATQDNLVNGT